MIQTLFGGYPIAWPEKRSSLENPQTPLSYPAEWLLDIFNGGRTDSGIRVSELTALQTSTVLICVDLVSGKVAALPRNVYERTLSENGRAIHRTAYEHDYYDLIATEPNEEMSSNTFFKAYLCHALLWGNGYAEIQRDASNKAVAIWPRNPAKTRPRRMTQAMVLPAVPWRPFPAPVRFGEMVYETTDWIDNMDSSSPDSGSRTPRLITKEDMLHLPGLALDGRIGQSVVWLARQTIGLALVMEKFGAKYFSNYARPGGILNMPANASEPQKQQARNSWMEAQGGENSNRVAVFPPGWTWQATTNNPEESQTTETRKYNRNELCSIFHVPPHMAGDVDRSRANTEQMAQELKEYCLDPWLSGIQQEFKRKLFPNSGVGRTPKNRFFMGFDLTDLLRPDAASRNTYYQTGRQWGFLNPNDCLALEHKNPITDPWGEQYLVPVNMTLSSTPINPNTQDGAGNGDVPPAERMLAVQREHREWVTLNGAHIFIGASEGKLSDKQKKAIASRKPCGADKQRIADRSEVKVSKALGIPRTRDNAAFDLRNDDVGIEIKTMVDGTNDKVTMSKAALGRKLAEAKAEGLKTFTVVADSRKGKTTYYISEKLGSLRLGGMEKATLAEIKERVRL